MMDHDAMEKAPFLHSSDLNSIQGTSYIYAMYDGPRPIPSYYPGHPGNLCYDMVAWSNGTVS